MSFRLEERPPGWSEQAPVQIRHELVLPAPPAQVFDVLADSARWPTWFKGMRRVRIDGPATGVGALRTVWVGPTRVQEHYIVWEPGHRITFHVVRSSAPGLRVMVEDYQISPHPGGSKLTITVGVEAKGPFRWLPGLVRFVVGRPTSGVLGITTVFSSD
jgi:uncharacterized protein YndB with AHSA1/START domain